MKLNIEDRSFKLKTSSSGYLIFNITSATLPDAMQEKLNTNLTALSVSILLILGKLKVYSS